MHKSLNKKKNCEPTKCRYQCFCPLYDLHKTTTAILENLYINLLNENQICYFFGYTKLHLLLLIVEIVVKMQFHCAKFFQTSIAQDTHSS